MNTDIRLGLSFQHHRKTKKLRRIIGDIGELKLIYLMMYAAANKPSGVFDRMTDEDIELSVDWEGEPGAFVQAVQDAEYLERNDDGWLQFHDWEEHQPWVAKAPARRAKAKKAAKARWDNQNEPPTENQDLTQQNDATSNAKPCPEQCSDMPRASFSNAPSPIPYPTPTPESDKPTEDKSRDGPDGKPAAAKFNYENWQPDEPCINRIRANDPDVTRSFIESERLDFITLAEDNRIPERLLRARFQSQVHRHWIQAKQRERNTGPLRTTARLKDIRDVPEHELDAWSRARGGPPPEPGETSDEYRRRIIAVLSAKPAGQDGAPEARGTNGPSQVPWYHSWTSILEEASNRGIMAIDYQDPAKLTDELIKRMQDAGDEIPAGLLDYRRQMTEPKRASA